MNALIARLAVRILHALCAALMLSSTVALSAEPPATPAVTSAAAVTGKGWVGSWLGTLEINADAKLRLALVASESDGKLSAVLESIDQGGMKIPASSISATSETGVFECSAIGGKFEGRFSADGSEIVGTWSQGPGSWPLTLKRQAPRG